MSDRILLSPPELASTDQEAVRRALGSGWIAPLGPEVDAFEAELASMTGRTSAAALSSGTAALHLALVILGVEPGDKVLVSSLTFAATRRHHPASARRPLCSAQRSTGRGDRPGVVVTVDTEIE